MDTRETRIMAIRIEAEAHLDGLDPEDYRAGFELVAQRVLEAMAAPEWEETLLDIAERATREYPAATAGTVAFNELLRRFWAEDQAARSGAAVTYRHPTAGFRTVVYPIPYRHLREGGWGLQSYTLDRRGLIDREVDLLSITRDDPYPSREAALADRDRQAERAGLLEKLA